MRSASCLTLLRSMSCILFLRRQSSLIKVPGHNHRSESQSLTCRTLRSRPVYPNSIRPSGTASFTSMTLNLATLRFQASVEPVAIVDQDPSDQSPSSLSRQRLLVKFRRS